MVGSYDGSGNFGDVLQLAGALETVSRLPGSPLPIAFVERAYHSSHSKLLDRYPDQLGSAVYASYDDGTGLPGRRLVELPDGIAPDVSILYLYGGGYLNHWWAERKL